MPILENKKECCRVLQLCSC